MSEEKYESIELPGVGEIRARPGTSTMELAGAAKFWHMKYQRARFDGFIGGASFTTFAWIAAVTIYHYLRSR